MASVMRIIGTTSFEPLNLAKSVHNFSRLFARPKNARYLCLQGYFQDTHVCVEECRAFLAYYESGSGFRMLLVTISISIDGEQVNSLPRINISFAYVYLAHREYLANYCCSLLNGVKTKLEWSPGNPSSHDNFIPLLHRRRRASIFHITRIHRHLYSINYNILVKIYTKLYQ